MNDQELENLLRRAPQPQASSGLKKQLLAQVRLPQPPNNSQISVTSIGLSGWLRRWWGALLPATGAIACSVVMAVQQGEIRDLRGSIGNLAQVEVTAAVSQAALTKANAATAETPTAEQSELARLKARATQLAAEIAGLEQKRIENENLRKELATLARLTADEQSDVEAMKAAREKAQRIACINNLKQLGIALRVYAIDNHDVFPPDYSSISNEVSALKVLICPADTNRVMAGSWATVTSAHSSYDYLAVNGSDNDPERVAMRCPIHGAFLLGDGSVQTVSPARQAALLVERDGKLYFKSEPPAVNAVPATKP